MQGAGWGVMIRDHGNMASASQEQAKGIGPALVEYWSDQYSTDAGLKLAWRLE